MTTVIHPNENEGRDGGLPDANYSPSSLTPETDALADEIYARGIRVSEIRMLQHARKMERERNEARAYAERFRTYVPEDAIVPLFIP